MAKLTTLLLLVSVLCGCASYGKWRPTVDSRGGDSANLERDLSECRELALQAAGGTGRKTAQGTGIGAVAGAAIGAMLGAVSGDPAGGAATGAALGGTAGGASSGLSAEERYKRVYVNCMIGRGHRVLD